MFPFHEDTIFQLAILSVGACMAFFTALRGWMGPWRAVILLTAGLAWPWPIAAYFGFDSYTLTVGLYLSAWTAIALFTGLVWGLIARRVASVLVIVALFPWIAGSAYVMERQRVPDAACAAEVEVHIGNVMLPVLRAIGFRSVTADGAPAPTWEGIYSDWAGAKPDVRALCRATDSGLAPVQVAHVWLSFSWFRRELETACESGSGALPMGAVCAAAARTTPTVIQLYARPDGIPAPSLSHFNTELITQAQSEGEPEGYRCGDSTVGPSIRYCTIWFHLEPEVLVVASAKLGHQRDGENPLADTILLIDAMLSRLDRE